VGTVWVPVTCPTCCRTEAMEEKEYSEGVKMYCPECLVKGIHKVMELDIRDAWGS
jgi:late competence protein required for DNA uptake (superfamily II DNA/RNA helicase)